VIGRLPVTWQTLDIVNASKMLVYFGFAAQGAGRKAAIYTGTAGAGQAFPGLAEMRAAHPGYSRPRSANEQQSPSPTTR
jgi:hypothetical protein